MRALSAERPTSEPAGSPAPHPPNSNPAHAMAATTTKNAHAHAHANANADVDVDVDSITWTVIDRLFKSGGGPATPNPLVHHQIESLNEFMEKKLNQIVQGFNSIQIHHKHSPDQTDFSYKIFINVINPTLSKSYYQTHDGTRLIMTPHHARMNNLTYAVQISADVHVVTEVIHEDGITERSEVTVPSVNIGKLPIMVRSKACVLTSMQAMADVPSKHECRYDPGGYFIINGNEKVVISQDRISENKTLVFSSSDGWTAEIRSVPDGVYLPPKITSLTLSNKPNHLGRTIRVNTAFLRNEIPLFVLFRLLGIETDRDIVSYILLDADDPRNNRVRAELMACAEDASEIYTQERANAYIVRFLGIAGTPREFLENPEQCKKILHHVLQHDFLPHVGTSFRRKALYLGYMTRKLLRIHLGYQSPDNRDSYLHKRVDTPGVLMSNLFRQCYGKMIKEMRALVQKDLQQWRATPKLPMQLIHKDNIHRFFKQSIVDMGFRYALSTGNWGVKTLGSFQNIRVGVAQVLNRMSYLSTLSHMRRINTPMEKNGKLVQPRKLENTQFGMICPAETPEGGSVGLVKNIALSARVTTNSSSAYLRQCILKMGVNMLDDQMDNPMAFLREMGSSKNVQVVVNGDIVGFTHDPVSIFQQLKTLKRQGVLSPMTSIAWDVQGSTLLLSTEAGRMVRPFFIVEDGELRLLRLLREKPGMAERLRTMPMHHFIADLECNAEGFIEYLDVEEIDKAMIAMTPADLVAPPSGNHVATRYTHCEIHAGLTMGVVACNIPFSDHNQAPRNCYQSSMGKQALGIYATNFANRIDTMGHVLNYGQRQMARTRFSKYLNMDKLPCGVNAIVAIMTHTGFNQEDSVMVNQAALDRGLFTSTYYKAFRDQCGKNHSTGEEEVFARPDPALTMQMLQPNNYDKLGPDGFVPKDTAVGGNDVLIGKIMPHKVHGQIQPRVCSMVLKPTDEGRVDMNYVGVNGEGYKFCKVRLRQHRVPMIGDKVASTHAQKGTIGMIYPQHDMPFTKNGISPDIIMNPHAIPSRMTIGQLFECLMGKAGCCMGAMGDATPFSGCKIEDLADVLESYGWERHGNEILYCGRTGRQMTTEIFIGPTYYQRLKHMVSDKAHSRGSNGPVVFLTRQPAEGRARNGGLRFGEMERDALISHGGSAFLKERMLDTSDNFRLFVCRTCGMPAVANTEKNLYACHVCKTQSDVVQIRIPYSMKLLLQELMCMSIGPRMLFHPA